MTRTAVIIPAAGSGSRMQQTTPKQLLPLAGKPVLLWTIEAFIGLVDDIIIPVSADIQQEVEALINQCTETKVVTQETTTSDKSILPEMCLVLGGASRQDSVARGLAALPEDVSCVLVHDAARPCVDRADIEQLLTVLVDHPAALLATPCHATVKYSSDGMMVDHTVDRSPLWLAATPQGFQRAVGDRAFQQLSPDQLAQATDDAHIMQLAGVPVQLVKGSSHNIKITTAEDLSLAEAILTN